MGNVIQSRKNDRKFEELLADLHKHRGSLGGLKWFTSDPQLTGDKLTVKQLRECTDFEYIYLTALGIQSIQQNANKIIQLNNGKEFARNPGTRLMETKCGITMHGNREGADACVRTAFDVLLKAYHLACDSDEVLKFFREGFQRTADPCLEGRVSRLLAYIESRLTSELNVGARPWEDFGVKPLSGASNMEIIGEYLRVFTNECIWTFSKRNKMSYAQAKEKSAKLDLEDIQCTAPAFMKYLKSAKVVPDRLSESAANESMQEFIKLDSLARGDKRYIPRNGANNTSMVRPARGIAPRAGKKRM